MRVAQKCNQYNQHVTCMGKLHGRSGKSMFQVACPVSVAGSNTQLYALVAGYQPLAPAYNTATQQLAATMPSMDTVGEAVRAAGSMVASGRMQGPWYAQAPAQRQQQHQAPSTGAGKPFPKVPSMLFDMELDESLQHSHAEEASSSLQDLKRFLMPLSTGEYKLRAEVEVAVAQLQHQGLMQDATADSCNRLATHLSKKGYHVHVRTALGGGDGFECLRNLRHVFLTVLPPGGHATTNRFVVDLGFKEQFRVAKPTPRYQALLECLPDVYVAPEAMVTPLVHLMCQEMAVAFHSNGAVLPPWREAKAMISRWNPRKSSDLAFPPLPTTVTPIKQGACNGAAPGSSNRPALHTHHQQEVRACLQQALDAAVTQAVSKQQQHVLVKPIACEPQRVLVGGNFSTIGFP